MFILKILGYRCISMRELVPYLQGKKKGKVIGLTFDDGYLDNITHATINSGFKKEGSYHLFALRLVLVMPFF